MKMIIPKVNQLWKPKPSSPVEVGGNIIILELKQDFFIYCKENNLAYIKAMGFSVLNEFYEPPLDAKLDKLLEEK